MLHSYAIEEVEITNSWVTIGMFDGVHRGHQAILNPLVQEAHAAGMQAVVVTFFPHPDVVLRGVEGAFYLSTPEERADLLGALGVDVVVTLTFNRQLAAMSADDFARSMVSRLGMRQLWVGNDFALGRGRQGDIPFLRKLGEELGYTVRVTPEITQDSVPGNDQPGVRISSTLIRSLIREGQMVQAARLLGRPYSVSGTVVHGEGRGRGLGIPTANVEYWPEKIVPANGIYATWTWVGDERIPSVTNVGVRPMYQGKDVWVEAHLLNFDRDLYGQNLRVDFLQYLRSEQRFPSVDAMLDQIKQDIINAQEILAHDQ